MKRILILTFILFQPNLNPVSAFAQGKGQPYPTATPALISSSSPRLDHLYPGYEPTVFNSYSEVQRLFDNMPVGFRGASLFGLYGGSQCFHRAEVWSYNFYRNQHVNAMKVFVFYTHSYAKLYHDIKGKKFNWWFHVAPYVMVRDPQTGDVKEWVVDPTFAKTPLDMKGWTDLFVETKHKCAEFVPYEKFKNEVENGPNAAFGTEQCYIMRVPAVDFQPKDVEARSAGIKTDYQWNYEQIEEALDKAVTNRNKDDYRRMLGF